MNKQKLIESVVTTLQCGKADAEKYINAVISGIEQGLVNDGKVTLVKHFSIEVKSFGARKAKNPQVAGALVDVPAQKRLRITASKNLKELINK